MPVAEGTRPKFVDQILSGGDDKKALDILQRTDPEYLSRLNSWHVLGDAYTGTGGFLDGSYLWPYPREEQSSFASRQKMARYFNYVETPVDLYVRFVTSQGVARTSENQEFNDWTRDVDGKGTSLDEYMKKFAGVSLVYGHAGCLVDKTDEAMTGPSQADDPNRVILSTFTAVSIPDWRFGKMGLKAVKLIEAADPVGIADELPEDEAQIQWLLWDEEGWARFNGDGSFKSADTPGLGVVPFVVLRPKPSPDSQMTGRPLIGNANIPRAIFNRAAEEDEVLRAQAFSMLIVTVPTDGNVNDAKTDLGNDSGTTKVLVVRANSAQYETPDQSVAENIRSNIAFLVQELFRNVHIRNPRNSGQVETGESIKQQNAELNEALQGLSKSMEQAEHEIFRHWCAWMANSPEEAERMVEDGQFSVAYPQEFFLGELTNDLDAWADAIRMDLGETMNKRIKKRAAMRVEPNMPEDIKAQVFQEIDQQAMVSETDKAKAEFDAMRQSFDNGDPEGQGIQNAG